jgi:hypothetical protein
MIFALCALACAPFALTACDTVVDESDLDNPPPQNVQEDPPIPHAEVIPFINDPQAELWKPGYWAMAYGKFVWVPGKVISRPSPTAVWNSAHWMHHTYGWCFEEGHWE